ncbi:PTS sugar transporter subunit IIA [Furfurilactobacillus entadae]|uniref:PTS sugar transporter subunit IIA n=1 Tax=Furfurilactobacillus entadae TaxID=2922307 RepID=UPI0038B36CB3
MSLLVLNHPVTITVPDHPHSEPIHIIIGLAPLDQTSHLTALSQLMQKIQDDKWVHRINQAKDVATITTLLEQPLS